MPWTKHIATYTEKIRAHSGSVEYWSCFLWETCSVGSKTFLVARKITVKNSGVFLQSECQTKNFQGESQIDHTRLFYIHSLRYTMAFQSFWNSPCKINFPFPENSVVCLSTFDSRCPIVPSDILIVILWFRLLLKKDSVELKLVNSISQRSCSAKF